MPGDRTFDYSINIRGIRESVGEIGSLTTALRELDALATQTKANLASIRNVQSGGGGVAAVNDKVASSSQNATSKIAALKAELQIIATQYERAALAGLRLADANKQVQLALRVSRIDRSPSGTRAFEEIQSSGVVQRAARAQAAIEAATEAEVRSVRERQRALREAERAEVAHAAARERSSQRAVATNLRESEARNRQVASRRQGLADLQAETALLRRVEAGQLSLAQAKRTLAARSLVAAGATRQEALAMARARDEVQRLRSVTAPPSGGAGQQDGLFGRGGIAGILTRAVALTATFVTLRAALRGVTESFRFLVTANSEMEQLQRGIANSTLIAGKFVDQFGRVLPLSQQVKLALDQAGGSLDRILEKSIKTGVNAEAIGGAFAVSIGPLLKAGVGLSDAEEITSRLVTIAERLNIPTSQLKRTIDNIVNNRNVERTELGTLLQLTAKQAGLDRERLGTTQFFLELTEAAGEISRDNLKTFVGLRNALQASVTLLARQAGGGFFSQIKGIVADVTVAVAALTNDQTKLDALNDRLETAGGLLAFIARVGKDAAIAIATGSYFEDDELVNFLRDRGVISASTARNEGFFKRASEQQIAAAAKASGFGKDQTDLLLDFRRAGYVPTAGIGAGDLPEEFFVRLRVAQLEQGKREFPAALERAVRDLVTAERAAKEGKDIAGQVDRLTESLAKLKRLDPSNPTITAFADDLRKLQDVVARYKPNDPAADAAAAEAAQREAFARLNRAASVARRNLSLAGERFGEGQIGVPDVIGAASELRSARLAKLDAERGAGKVTPAAYDNELKTIELEFRNDITRITKGAQELSSTIVRGFKSATGVIEAELSLTQQRRQIAGARGASAASQRESLLGERAIIGEIFNRRRAEVGARTDLLDDAKEDELRRIHIEETGALEQNARQIEELSVLYQGFGEIATTAFDRIGIAALRGEDALGALQATFESFVFDLSREGFRQSLELLSSIGGGSTRAGSGIIAGLGDLAGPTGAARIAETQSQAERLSAQGFSVAEIAALQQPGGALGASSATAANLQTGLSIGALGGTVAGAIAAASISDQKKAQRAQLGAAVGGGVGGVVGGLGAGAAFGAAAGPVGAVAGAIIGGLVGAFAGGATAKLPSATSQTRKFVSQLFKGIGIDGKGVNIRPFDTSAEADFARQVFFGTRTPDQLRQLGGFRGVPFISPEAQRAADAGAGRATGFNRGERAGVTIGSVVGGLIIGGPAGAIAGGLLAGLLSGGKKIGTRKAIGDQYGTDIRGPLFPLSPQIAGLGGEAETTAFLLSQGPGRKIRGGAEAFTERAPLGILSQLNELNIASEDASGIIRELGRSAADSFGEAANRLLTARGQAKLTNAEFTKFLAGTIDSFQEDLPRAIDRTVLSLAALRRDGTASIVAVERATEDATLFFQAGIPGALAQLRKTGDEVAAGRSLADSLADTFNQRLEERILQQGAIGTSLTRAAVLAGEAADALAKGDTARFQQLVSQSVAELDRGKAVALQTLQAVAAGQRQFDAALGIPFANGLIVGTNVLPNTTTTSNSNDAALMRHNNHLLSQLVEANGRPVQLVVADKVFGEVVYKTTANAASQNRTGLKTPLGNAGVQR